MGRLRIGEVAEQTGLSTPAIRYYESIGLLRTASRSPSGYREYSERTIAELRFIRKAQALGFDLNEIAEILKLSRSGQQPCARVLTLADRHLRSVDERIRQLQHFRAYLAGELSKWQRKRTATTCDGLCDFITASEPENAAAPPFAIGAGSTRKRQSR